MRRQAGQQRAVGGGGPSGVVVAAAGVGQRRRGRFFLFLFHFFAECQKCTRQSLCRMHDKLHMVKVVFADACLPCALCRVQLIAMALPCVFKPLPCASNTLFPVVIAEMDSLHVERNSSGDQLYRFYRFIKISWAMFRITTSE